MESNKIVSYIIISLLLGLLAGYYVGSSVAYEQARSEIKSRLEERRIIEPRAKETKTVSGVIKSLGDSQFVLEISRPFDPTLSLSEQSGLSTKTVLINSKTQISVRTLEPNLSEPKAGEPFQPFAVKNLMADFSSLNVGEAVVVEAAEDVSNRSSFEATAVFKNSR